MQSARPKRIQRKRTKGWKLPPNAVIVTRPTKWGNPFRLTDDKSAGEVVRQYREWLNNSLPGQEIKEAARVELRGKHLVCWCPLWQACHGKVLLEIANA